MNGRYFLGIDCGSVSLNLVLLERAAVSPVSLYRRTRGRPLETFVSAIIELETRVGRPFALNGALVTGSGRELLSSVLEIPAINEISAHAAGAHAVDPRIRTVIEIGGQDSKFIRIEPSLTDGLPRIVSFRMNEICAAGTGAFLDEQADRLGIPVESFSHIALQSEDPVPIAARCAVFAKTDMIHQAQEGRPLPDILMGVSLALARNYAGTLIRGDALMPLISLQGGVMANGAVVKAFRQILSLPEEEAIIPPHFKVLGALGCAVIATESQLLTSDSSLLKVKATRAGSSVARSGKSAPLIRPAKEARSENALSENRNSHTPPYIMGLDVGSVSVKGVIIDADARIVAEDYRLSEGRPLESLNEVVKVLREKVPQVSIYAVTGSGRSLVGRLIGADLIVNEITAQARAAVHDDPLVDTVIEIGGQDSKWISVEAESLKDFEMNRVCAAGTGSFLMEQADRLNIPMGEDFADAAFSSSSPADLGTRCTVFMESDLVHHQNNGASSADLSAGVCVSVVRNYLERVSNHRPLGERIVFLGGVAGNEAVRAAFERETGRSLRSPDFFKVSGALGAALKASDAVRNGELPIVRRTQGPPALDKIPKEVFTCGGCSNRCTIDKYRLNGRVVMHGGRCDRWEAEDRPMAEDRGSDPFTVRTNLISSIFHSSEEHAGRRVHRWGMIRSPHFYDRYAFWNAFLGELGVELVVSPPPDREQFESGTRFLRVETCLPMKVMAGQVRSLIRSGVTTLFHPAIISEPPLGAGARPAEHCPYIQASSQFLKGSFDVEWIEPVVAHHLDPESFRNEHLRLASTLGLSSEKALRAYERGLESQRNFERALVEAGRIFLESLPENDRALVILGKPYHTSEPFLNMDLGSLFRRLEIKAIPGDLLPVESYPTRSPITWKHQLRTIAAARAVARDPRLYPILITFFGCGPDPFTQKHVKESLKGKPLLVLEMDEHSSRAGVVTRIEAYMDRLGRSALRARLGGITRDSKSELERREDSPSEAPAKRLKAGRRAKIERIYLPYFGDHAYGFAAAAGAVDIEASVLPPPDVESERSGRPHLMGGECHPYALILGDYLKLVRGLLPDEERRSIFCVPGYSACRLGQYPVYIEKIRKELGHGTRVIADLSQALTAFGLSKKNMNLVRLKTWEGLLAYDVLIAAYTSLRPRASDPLLLEETYTLCRESLFRSLCRNEIEQGMHDVLEELERIPLSPHAVRPVVAVTGDYYTRIVPFANNEVYREIEQLGGTVMPPPTFSDGLKLYYLQEIVGNGSGIQDLEDKTNFYAALALSELRIKGSSLARKVSDAPLDPFGLRMRRTAGRHLDDRYPTGMAAPLATALSQIERGVDGVLNLITLNCSYGTVVTAALNRATHTRPDVPILTLVYDGLKKTNERTRLEAFMGQVHHHFGKHEA